MTPDLAAEWVALGSRPPPVTLDPVWLLERVRVQVAQVVGFDPFHVDREAPHQRTGRPAVTAQVSRGRQLVWWLTVQLGLDPVWLAEATGYHRATVRYGVRRVQLSVDSGGWGLEALAHMLSAEYPGTRPVRGSVVRVD